VNEPKTQHQIIPQPPTDTGVHMDVVDGKLVVVSGASKTREPVVYETPEDLLPFEVDWV